MINPITKFGLCTRPVCPPRVTSRLPLQGEQANRQLNVTIETILSIQPSLPGDESQILTGPQLDADGEVELDKLKTGENMKAILRVGSRIMTTGICVITAILLPGFGKVMAFLGSFSAFLICIILPVSSDSFSLFLSSVIGQSSRSMFLVRIP